MTARRCVRPATDALVRTPSGEPVRTLLLKQFRWKGPNALAAGKHTTVFDFEYGGPGVTKGGSTVVLKVDGRDGATQTMELQNLFLTPVDEMFDVGVDTYTSVDKQDYNAVPPHRHDR